MNDISKQKGQDNADNIESQVGSVDKISPEASYYNVDDQDDSVDQEQIVLFVEGCVIEEKWTQKANQHHSSNHVDI
jgi:hypothetical protein